MWLFAVAVAVPVAAVVAAAASVAWKKIDPTAPHVTNAVRHQHGQEEATVPTTTSTAAEDANTTMHSVVLSLTFGPS